MEISSFIENFANLFDETDFSEFKSETIYKNLPEWSSLIALSVLAMIDEEYDVQIKGDDLKNTETIIGLYNIILLRKQ